MNVLDRDVSRHDGTVIGVLFVCTENARCSLIAEALLRDQGMPGVRAFSAGIRPADHADSFTLSALMLAGLGVEGLWPKDWQSFASRTPAIIHVVVSLSDEVATDIEGNFPSPVQYHAWPHPYSCEHAAARHHGVWRDIQALRPRIDALCEDLRAMQELNVAGGNP